MNARAIAAAVLLIIAAIVVALILMDVIRTGFFAGPFRFSHWMAWAGSIFVAVFAPLYHVLKRRYPQRFPLLMDIHSFGFLIAFILISIHYAGQLNRTPLPELGEGIGLLLTMALLVSTGLIQRFWRPEKKPYLRYTPRFNRAIHTSLLSAFYIILVVHAATNLL